MKKKMLTALLVGLTLCACQQPKAPQESMTYKTMTVAPEERTLLSEYTATIAGQQEVEVRPQVTGLITRICIGEG
ncbi:MAG: efflux RND transporter periplasmic adaptor subunit, partial [Odoribacter sp.]|nr:efflux RND transporter periplasmic adaptor subunit [Odoribacter sp.]